MKLPQSLSRYFTIPWILETFLVKETDYSKDTGVSTIARTGSIQEQWVVVILGVGGGGIKGDLAYICNKRCLSFLRLPWQEFGITCSYRTEVYAKHLVRTCPPGTGFRTWSLPGILSIELEV